MLRAILVACVCVIISTTACWAQSCPAEITHSTTGSGAPGSFLCTENDGVYDISIVAASTGVLTYTVEIDDALPIGKVEITNEGGSSTALVVSLTTAGRVESVIRAGGSGEVWIGTISAAAGIGTGSGGAISVDRIVALSTSGDITASISVAGSILSTESVGSISCDGDFLNDIMVTNGLTGTLDIAGGLEQ